MRAKDSSVSFEGMSPAMLPMMMRIDTWLRSMYNEELTITAGSEVHDKNGKLIIEPKSSIKVTHGESPDHGDMFVIGLWAFDKVDAVSFIDTLRSGDDDEDYEALDVNDKISSGLL